MTGRCYGYGEEQTGEVEDQNGGNEPGEINQDFVGEIEGKRPRGRPGLKCMD